MLASVALPPAWLAAVLLLGRTIAEAHDLDCPPVDAIVRATGASKSHAYQVAAKIAALLPTLVRAPGRPAHAPSPTPADDSGELVRAVLAYVMAHPGCVDRGAQRNRYAESFRRFVLALRAEHSTVDLDAFARDVGVPVGTLKDWLRSQPPPSQSTTETSAPSTSAVDLSIPHAQTVIDAYCRWRGSFLDFCDHVRRDLHVPFGRDLVRRILEADGRRKPARREGEHSPDELALRGTFRTYFPGAQWVGDGMQVPIVVDGHRFVFNIELNVDAYAGALVGASVRDNEDSAAVVEAFQGGVATTGASPIALLLDNKPSNHTAEVDAALDATIRIRATPRRRRLRPLLSGPSPARARHPCRRVRGRARLPRARRRCLGTHDQSPSEERPHRPLARRPLCRGRDR